MTSQHTGWVSVERITTLPLSRQRHPPLVEGNGKKALSETKGSVVTPTAVGRMAYRSSVENRTTEIGRRN